MGRWLSYCVLFIVFSLSVSAQQKVLHLSADSISYKQLILWQYINADDIKYSKPDFNDSNWQVVNSKLPLDKKKEIKFDSVAWFRLHVDVDSDLVGEPIWVNLNQLGASELYIDGKLIKKSGQIAGKDKSAYFSSRTDPFVITFKKPGMHLLALRYANYHNKVLMGEDKDVGVQVVLKSVSRGLDDYHSYRHLVVAATVFIVFFITMFLTHLFLYLYYRAERSNLYFSLYCLAFSACFFLPLLALTIDDPWVAFSLRKWLLLPYALLGFSLSGLSNHLFSRSKKRLYFWAALGILAIVLSFIVDNDLPPLIVAFIVFGSMLESFILTSRAIYRRVKGAKIIGIGILFFSLFFFGLLGAATMMEGMYLTGESLMGKIVLLLLLLAILSIPLSMSIYLAWKFSHINKDLKYQLSQVNELSEKTLQQEQEKKKMLESEKERLELQVEERTKEITEEKRKSDELLLNILPEEIADELKERGTSDAKYFDHVTVMFTDFVDFTKAGEKFSPQELVNELDTCFKAFDRIVSKYHIEKIKTIGDAYLCVSGLPSADEEHAVKTVQAAVDILAYMKQRQQDYPERTFNIRIGIHSGAVVAGIVGVKKFAYDIWGDTVNTAARMESSSTPNKINISEATYELVQEYFVCTGRGEIAAKNKGEMSMYFVEGRK